MKQIRMILTAGAGIAVLAYGATSFAHPAHDGKEEVVREVKVVNDDGEKTIEIHKVIKGDKAASADVDKQEFVADCGKGRKFESASTAGGQKEKHVSKMVICSDPGESDADWAKTLRGALARVEANKDMPPEAKATIMADLQGEIAKIGK